MNSALQSSTMPSTTTLESTKEYTLPRRWQRFKLDVPVRVVVPRKDKTTIISARGTEMNEGGLAVFAGTELNVGDQVFVEFTPPYSGKPLRVPAIVRNRSGYGYGVEFQSTTPDEHEQVSKFRVLLQVASGTF